MIAPVTMYRIECDSCHAHFEWIEFGEETALFQSVMSAATYAVTIEDWTHDGAGKHHCDACPPLEPLPVALDDLARLPSAGDTPLEFGAGVSV